MRILFFLEISTKINTPTYDLKIPDSRRHLPFAPVIQSGIFTKVTVTSPFSLNRILRFSTLQVKKCMLSYWQIKHNREVT